MVATRPAPAPVGDSVRALSTRQFNNARKCRACAQVFDPEHFPLLGDAHACAGRWVTRTWCAQCLVARGHLSAGAARRYACEFRAVREERAGMERAREEGARVRAEQRAREAEERARKKAARTQHRVQKEVRVRWTRRRPSGAPLVLSEVEQAQVEQILARRERLVAKLLDKASSDEDWAAAVERAARIVAADGEEQVLLTG